jgi:EAL domain-containing protein (putative c-di-GMP-specific phosphodiesterase class I)
MLVEIETDMVKVDMTIVRGVDHLLPNSAIVESIVRAAERMKILVIAEGVETTEEYKALVCLGVHLMQGYYFAKPRLGRFPAWTVPDTAWLDIRNAQTGKAEQCEEMIPQATNVGREGRRLRVEDVHAK